MGDGDATDDTRVLQDLSVTDAEELQAFVDKRKWFEVKLQKELESYAPIYPFIHVNLKSDERGLDTVDTTSASELGYKLPTAAQVLEWQSERDNVEEQVVAFDGGDLERMKQKTRAVTLIPLTPPSTALVEVTLDLIVVVDRLLTLLRRRSELLELTKLRLQWDGLRMSCADELAGMQAEGASIVMRKCEWFPTGAVSRMIDTRPSERPPSSPTPPSNQAPVLLATPTTPKQRTSLISNTTSPSNPSPSSSPLATTRRASLRIPLLRSQIVNLRIRHTTFSTTVLPRAGALLDKMIDIAGPLKGLGGVDGPKEEEQKGDGAVPEELLDAQEDLESRAGEVGEHVQWCQQLEAQCTNAENVHLTLLQIRQSAADIVVRSASIVENEDVQSLWQEWTELFDSLPASINLDSCTSLQTDEYPQNVEHESQIVGLLEDARQSARSELDKGKEALTWLRRLAEQRILVDRCCSELEIRETEIVGLLQRVSSSNTLSTIPPTDSDKLLASDLDEWHTRTTQADLEKPDLLQRSTIIGMKYRAILKSPPESLRSTAVRYEDLSTRLDDLDEAVSAKTAELRQARSRMLRDQEIVSLAVEIQDAGRTMEVELDAVKSDIEHALELAPWNKSRKMPTPEDFGQKTEPLNDRLQSGLVILLGQLETLIRDEDRYSPILADCLGYVVSARSALSKIHERRTLLEKAVAQATAVGTIQNEATQFLDDMQDSDLATAALSKIEADVKSWLDNIASRVTFLSTSESSLDSDDDSASSTPSPTEVSRISTNSSAPLASPTPSSGVGFDLEPTDHAVRDEINNLTARVSSALARSLNQAAQSSVFVHESTEYPEPSTAISDQADQSQQSQTHTTQPSGKGSVLESTNAPNYRIEAPKVCVRHASGSQASRPRSSASTRASTSTLPLKAAPAQTKSASLGRAAGKSYSFRREPSISSGLTSRAVSSTHNRSIDSSATVRNDALLARSTSTRSISSGLSSRTTSSTYNRSVNPSATARNDALLARSTSTRSISLGRSTTSTHLARRVLSASSTSSSSQTRISSPRISIITSKRSACKYVPDPASKLDVAVGDIVNGFKVHVPIIPVGATAKDEYKDMTGSYWIGAEGRAKLCYCRILRSQMVMVRVGGGWVELSSFLADHFTETASQLSSSLGQSMSRLSLTSQDEETSTNPVTPVRSRVTSTASNLAASPDRNDLSPRQAGETDSSPLTPLRFIKRASDSPDMRKKEKASLGIGRRSILGKE